MSGMERHLFPGNNTPSGFFSYYEYILNQDEGQKIYCLKGGPGAGKSTLIGRIGKRFLKQGEDVDFFHCSADRNSLDAILLKKRNIAVLDGTSPHVIDPVNPGAVDTIVNLGDCWNEHGIRANRHRIIESHKRCSSLFSGAYHYLAAAEQLYDNLREIYSFRIKPEEYTKLAAGWIGKELAHKQISSRRGATKKFFACAVTPQGIVSELSSLLNCVKKVYRIETCVGLEPERILKPFAESALNRGFDLELYYSPLKPETGLEHIICPELGLALITDSDLQHWSGAEDGRKQEIITVNLCEKAGTVISGALAELERDSRERFYPLLDQAVYCLSKAKEEHDRLESYYIPHIDFDKVRNLEQQITEEISEMG